MRCLPLLLAPLYLHSYLCAQGPAPAGTGASDPFAALPTQPAPPPTSAEDLAIIARLEKMQDAFQQQKREVVAAAISKYNNAAQSELTAVDFYFACMGLVQARTPVIDSTPPDSKRDMRAEQERAEDRRKAMVEDAYSAPGRGAVLKLQLEYLLYTLEKTRSDKRDDVVARFREFAGKAAGIAKTYATPGVELEKKPAATVGSRNSRREGDDRRRQELDVRGRRNLLQALDQSVMGSLFSQAYSLPTYVKEPEKWSSAPLDLQVKYEGTILPHYRATKPTELNQVWDEYLGYSIAVERARMDDPEYARWATVSFKDMQWTKWMDIARYGQRSIAISELANLVTQNPAHPSMERWMTDLMKLKDEIIQPKVVAP